MPSPAAALTLSVRTTTASGPAMLAVTVEDSEAVNGSPTVSLAVSPFGVTVGGTAPSAGTGVTMDGATVSMRRWIVLPDRLPATSLERNTTVCGPSPSTSTDASVSGTG